MAIFKKKKAGEAAGQAISPGERALLTTGTSLTTGQMGLASTLKAAWELAKPFFRAEKREYNTFLLRRTPLGRAFDQVTVPRALLAGSVALTVGEVGMALAFNQWWGSFSDTVMKYDAAGVRNHLLLYPAIGVPWVASTALLPKINSELLIRWRQAMTEDMHQAWLKKLAYCRLPHNDASTDVPEQRMNNAVDDFTRRGLALSTSFLKSSITFGMFAGVLWRLSALEVLGLAAGYTVLGTGLIFRIGRQLSRLHDRYQQQDAEHRYAIVRARENAESIAFYGGEEIERKILSGKFASVAATTHDLIRKNFQMMAFASGYSTLAAPLAWAVMIPQYFARASTFGQVQASVGAFNYVQGSLSWFVNSFNEYAQFRTSLARVGNFRRSIDEWNAAMATQPTTLRRDAGGSGRLDMRDLTVKKPGTDETLIRPFSLTLKPGDRLVLTGVAGSGKSSLLRVLAGLWPDAGAGEAIVQQEAKILSVPQKPYLPLLPLRGIVSYPADQSAYTDEQVREALGAAGMGHLAPLLDDAEKDGKYWSTLSGGEQQRLCFARILLHKPDILLLDEVTSSLDPAAESDLYSLVVGKLPQTTIISVAHREKVMHFHTLHAHVADRTLNLKSLETAGPALQILALP